MENFLQAVIFPVKFLSLFVRDNFFFFFAFWGILLSNSMVYLKTYNSRLLLVQGSLYIFKMDEFLKKKNINMSGPDLRKCLEEIRLSVSLNHLKKAPWSNTQLKYIESHRLPMLLCLMKKMQYNLCINLDNSVQALKADNQEYYTILDITSLVQQPTWTDCVVSRLESRGFLPYYGVPSDYYYKLNSRCLENWNFY